MPLTKSLSLPALLIGACWVCGCGPDVPSRFDSLDRAIIDGVPDTDPAHRAVVAIDFELGMCSGTLIQPRIVMTAAHCIWPRKPEAHVVFFGANTQDAERRAVSAVWRHPDYNSAEITNDIGLLRLAADAPAGVVPLPYLPRELMLTDDDRGMPLQFVGFGRDENMDYTTKLTITGKLDKVCEDDQSCAGLGYPSKAKTLCYDESEGGPCFGDSGGPALVLRPGGEYVAGITSYVTDRACSLLACSTKVDAFTDYIRAFIEADGQKGDTCQDDLECLTGHCTDGVCCDYACESLCETCNQAGSVGTCARATGPDAPDECRLDGGGCASTGDDGGGGLFAGILVLLSLIWLVDAVHRKAWRAPRSGSRRKE